MRNLALWLSVTAALPGLCLAQPGVNANLATAKEANSIDLGCLNGAQQATKFPTTQYDAATHERIMYNISRCTGGFIQGTNTDTWKTWHADIAADGSMKGTDADGDAWRYDKKAKLYTNLVTGRSCAKSNLRRVCAQ